MKYIQDQFGLFYLFGTNSCNTKVLFPSTKTLCARCPGVKIKRLLRIREKLHFKHVK